MGSKKQSKLRMSRSFGQRDGQSRLSDMTDRLYCTVGLSIMTTRIGQWWERYFYEALALLDFHYWRYF